MTLLNEAAETDQGLEDYLNADAELMSLCNGAYSTFIGTTGTPLPVVRFFQVNPSDDLLSIGAQGRVWAALDYQVDAIDSGTDTTQVREIATRVDELLHGLRGQTWGSVFVEEVVRQSSLFRKQVEGGDPYCYATAEYRFKVSAP